jgi:hypothetical protein
LEGDTLEEARKSICDAIELFLELADEPVSPEGGRVEELTVGSLRANPSSIS